MSSEDQSGWWIGAGGVVTAILTAVASWFASSRRQDAENESRKDTFTAGVMREMFDRQKERIDELEKRADDCEQDRANLSAKVREADLDRARMTDRIAHLEAQGGSP